MNMSVNGNNRTAPKPEEDSLKTNVQQGITGVSQKLGDGMDTVFDKTGINKLTGGAAGRLAEGVTSGMARGLNLGIDAPGNFVDAAKEGDVKGMGMAAWHGVSGAAMLTPAGLAKGGAMNFAGTEAMDAVGIQHAEDPGLKRQDSGVA